jgi:hypothetical protein
MTVIVPHHTTQQDAIQKVDRGFNEMFKGFFGLQFVNPVKTWQGPRMNFSLTGKVGFIEIPLSGNAAVDDTNVTVNLDLPPMVNNLIGEAKVRGELEQKIKGFLAG